MRTRTTLSWRLIATTITALAIMALAFTPTMAVASSTKNATTNELVTKAPAIGAVGLTNHVDWATLSLKVDPGANIIANTPNTSPPTAGTIATPARSTPSNRNTMNPATAVAPRSTAPTIASSTNTAAYLTHATAFSSIAMAPRSIAPTIAS